MSIMAQYPPGSNMQPGFQHGHPGMAPTPNQHMGQQMQMQPGVSGPPHVSQAGAMMGMQPGAVGGMPGVNGMGGMGGQHPGAGMGMPGQGQMNSMHAMNMAQQQQQFLQQQQQQLQQQQHQQGQPLNPQQQMQLQHLRQQQVAMQQRATQMGIPPQNLQGMNPMQMQAYMQQHASQMNQAAFQTNQQQQPNAVQLPAHLMAQQRQIQVQQQQAAQQQQQNSMMQQQQQQQQQQMAMQPGHSQQSNPGQQPTPNPQGQPGHPGQMRPQSRMANPNEPSQQPPQPQQQNPQQGQPGQPQHQQGGQPTPQSTPQQQQSMTPQQQQQLMAQAHQQQQQQALNQQRLAMMQRNQLQQSRQRVAMENQQPQQLQGQYMLQLMNFADKLGSYTCTEGERDGRVIANWQDFVDRHFAPDGRLTLQLWDQPARHIEMPRATLARFFQMYFETGASSLRLHTENLKENFLPDGSGRCRLSCQNATLTVSYPNGSRVELGGPLVILFSANTNGTMFEVMEFLMNSCEEHLSRSEIEKCLANLSPTMSNQKSPKMTKSKLPKAQQKLQQQNEGLTIESFPKAPKSQSGMSMRMLQFLEISDTMSIMNELIVYAHEKNLHPSSAIEQLNAEYEKHGGASNPQIQLPPGQNGQQAMMPNGMPMNGGTPRMSSMPMPGQAGFQASPAMQHMGLPNGSPHVQHNLAPGQNGPGMGTPSPAQTQMVAPSMVPQRSQQGTNSSAASANTSPQVNNKRRRSTVKLEGDDGGGEGGNKVKPSPRMGKKAKPS